MAAESRSLVERSVDREPALLSLPGLRAFRSERFRIAVALVVLAVGVVVLGFLLVRQASSPTGQYAFDFATYHTAAGEVAAGRSPYAPSMFEGPIPAQGEGAQLYKYPPTLAQLLVPMAGLPLRAAALIWFIAQAAAVFGATYFAARAGGARRSLETAAWSAVATTLFLPAFDTLWKGNVSGFLALAVAVALAGGAGAGAGAFAATLLKTTPGVLLLPAIAAGRRALVGVALGIPLLVSSFVLSPSAWVDFARVIPNLLSGPSLFANNFAPHSLVGFALPSMPLAADVARLVAVVVGVLALAASVLYARQQQGWPAALTLAVGTALLLPSATWYHYLVVLLPLAAFAWPCATARQRVMLFAGAGAITVGLAAFALVVLGAVALVVATLLSVAPRRTATA